MSLLVESFQRLAGDRSSELALWSRGEDLRLSFSELADDIDRWKGALQAIPGPVALATGNVAAFPALFLALRALDVAAVAVDGTRDETSTIETCRRLGVRWILHRGQAGRDVGAGVRCVELEDVEPVIPPTGTALIKLTSGTTGDPEGVCLDESALLDGIRQIAAGMEITTNDTVLIAIPLSHSYGFDNGVLSLAVVGTPLVLEPRIFPQPLLRALAEGQVTFFPAVPPLVRALGQVEWPGSIALRRVICAGGPLEPDFADAFHRRSGRPVHQFYGSTETGGIAFERRPLEGEAKGTVGHPLPGVELVLDDNQRVAVRSPASFGGYFGHDERLAPREVLTGDTAEITATGRLRLTGRVADFLKVGGRRVSVHAVEREIRRLDGVADAAVVGVADPFRGDRMVAFVEMCNGADTVDVGCLPPGWVPREVRIVDRLPYTDRGKLDRDRLRSAAEGNDGG